jgi:hypothetical protein
MSQHTVDEVIGLANEFNVPLVLVASRRQIEARDLGGGYVHRWSTESFIPYVRARDAQQRIVIARDHGGPWQGAAEQDLNLAEAMASAKRSYQVDIESGVDLIHIDPNKGPWGTTVDLELFTERTIELMDFCVGAATACGRVRPLAFEIGTDEGVMASAAPEQIEQMYLRVREHCERSGIAPPAFLVVPTGTLVKERRNVGTLEPWLAEHGDLEACGSLARLLKFCHSYGVLVKEHNADYLADATLAWHATSAIDAVNVAPQLGVVETLCFVGTLQKLGLTQLVDRFVQLVIASHKWERWLSPDSSADEWECAIIAGHYVFSNAAYYDIKSEAVAACARHGIDLDQNLRSAVRQEILRHLHLLSIVPAGSTVSSCAAVGSTIDSQRSMP